MGKPVRRGGVPWGLVGMAVLVVSAESAVARRGAALTPTDAHCWRVTAALLDRHAPAADVLCFGDSLIKYGVYSRAFERLTGRPTYNLAVNAGPSPLSYFFLRRALARGARPSAILVDAGDFCLPLGPAWDVAPVRFPWADVLTWAETAELCWSARDHRLLARIAVEKALPSVSNRQAIGAAVVAALGGATTSRRTANFALARNLAVNAGAQVNVNWMYDPKAPEPPPGVVGDGTFAPDPLNVLYLRRAFRLAQSHGIPVYWVLPPVHPHTQAVQRYEGNEGRMTRFVRGVQARHPEVVVVDGRGTGFDRAHFLDSAHLNHNGALAYTSALADVLTRTRPGRVPAGSWLVLAGPRPAPPGVPLEDIARSTEIAHAVVESTRR